MTSRREREDRFYAESCLVWSPILQVEVTRALYIDHVNTVQFGIAALRTLAAVYASYVHDKIYLLLFIGVPL